MPTRAFLALAVLLTGSQRIALAERRRVTFEEPAGLGGIKNGFTPAV